MEEGAGVSGESLPRSLKPEASESSGQGGPCDRLCQQDAPAGSPSLPGRRLCRERPPRLLGIANLCPLPSLSQAGSSIFRLGSLT